MLTLHNKRGDTIVEVLIALAVLGSVLVGGYSIATRSINSVRASQERGEALKVAEGQIEQLRSYLGGVSDLKPNNGKFDDVFIKENSFFAPNTFPPAIENGDQITAFCFTANPTVPVATPITYFKNNLSPTAATSYIGAVTPPAAGCVADGRYRIAIVPRYQILDETDETASIGYTVTVRWDRVGGGSEESLSLSYRTVVGGFNYTTGP